MLALNYATSFLVAAIVTTAILPSVIRLAHRFGAVDSPGGRRVHLGQVPRLGGIGIFLGFITGVGAALLVAGRALNVGEPDEHRWYGAAVGACLIFAAGLLDDIFGFRARVKLFLQVVAASIAVSSGVTIEAISLPFDGSLQLGILGPVVALFWILLITNAINLVDGLDGLAGGIALIVTVTIASVALANGRPAVVVLALALSGAVLGFLKYNFTPARVFMGDGGSQFIGFILAIISIRGAQKGATAVAIAVPLLVLGLPLMDLATTVIRRARQEGASLTPTVLLKSIMSADRKHLHHNLLDLGLHPRRAVLTLYLITALFALSGYLSLVQRSLPIAGLSLMLSVGAVVVIKLLLAGGRERRRARPAERRSPEETLSH